MIAAINRQTAIQIQFQEHFLLFHQLLKNWQLSPGYFDSYGHALMAGRCCCREVVVAERWPLVGI